VTVGTLRAVDEQLPEASGDGPEPQPTRSRRWPLGLLTVIVVGFVAVGILIFRDDGTTSEVTVPPLGNGATDPSGDVAPDFALDLLDGTRFRLSDHLADDGRPILLNLWASWCGPCRAEMPALDTASREHPEVLFLGVAVDDDPVAAEQFAEEVAVAYPLAVDEADRVARRYPSFGLPATFLIDAEGKIARTIYGQLVEAQIDALLAEAFG
jgi:thiol-disulfide isomerase/thioredoxin